MGTEPSLTGVNFIIVGGPEAIGWPPLVEYAADLGAVGVPVFLSARGKLGYVLGMMRLNDRLMSATQSRDTRRIRRELATALDACLAYPGLAKSEDLPGGRHHARQALKGRTNRRGSTSGQRLR
jgi:hypothetical protein